MQRRKQAVHAARDAGGACVLWWRGLDETEIDIVQYEDRGPIEPRDGGNTFTCGRCEHAA